MALGTLLGPLFVTAMRKVIQSLVSAPSGGAVMDTPKSAWAEMIVTTKLPVTVAALSAVTTIELVILPSAVGMTVIDKAAGNMLSTFPAVRVNTPEAYPAAPWLTEAL